ETNAALGSAMQDEAPQWIKDRFTELWSKHSEPLLRSLEARMEDRTNGMKKLLQERRDKEVAEITAILKELERNIMEELHAAPAQLQLSFEEWSESEREQLRFNVSSLEARVKRIPQGAICAVDDLGGLASSDRAKKKQMKGDFLRWVEGLAVLTR